MPICLRGKVVGALLALDGESPLIGETVQLLAFLTGLLLETLAVRPVIPTPSLLDPQVIAGGLEATAAAAAAPAEILPMVEAPAAAPEPEEETAAAAEPEPVAPPPAAPAAAAIPEVPAGHDAAATVQLKVPPKPVTAERTPELDRKHEEARRFARLLVSEIRLYNEQAVQDGRVARDIYHRLKEDVDRSREMYEQRVPADVRRESNYFYDELVRILGDGDPDTLGL